MGAPEPRVSAVAVVGGDGLLDQGDAEILVPLIEF
jgi:hypothetical protein